MTSKLTLEVERMSCRHCVKTVKEALLSNEGVSKADVKLEENKAYVEYDSDKVSKDDLVKAVNDSGYKAKA
ncbi:MAG: copper ion binding protein [Halanaerobiales bacterium]|nr:copper ion binding protein [Halanaerobiales bacterium]